MLIIGLMSGTSADGIDAALVEIQGRARRIRIRLLGFQCHPHDKPTRDAILRLCDPRRGRIPELCALDALLGKRFAKAARGVAESAGISLSEVDAIASHGQTIWHQPDALPIAGREGRGTLQIGNSAVIAAETSCTVVSDFRSADMAAGGQGAPLVPFADWAIFTSGRETRAVQNIGGIANVTFLTRGASLEQVLAFDTGPGNMLIDGVVRILSDGTLPYDRDGEWAATGAVNQAMLARLLKHPYFRKPPPKTTGREMFGESYVRRVIRQADRLGVSNQDLVATVTALTAESIARAYRRWLDKTDSIKTVIVGGGGAHNQTLMRMLSERMAPARLTTHEEFGIPTDAKEAIAFAILGYQTLRGRPSNVPSATGAAYPAILGSLTPPPKKK